MRAERLWRVTLHASSSTGQGGEYMWDELAAAAWIDPSLITKSETRYMSVDLDRGAGYGNTLTWTEKDKPKTAGQGG